MIMSDIITLLFGVAGGVLLYFGADYLVKGGVGIARKLRIPTLVIGLTMVAFGTSAPELTVSIDSALRGKGDISVGNVLGSNICNLALILGLCAILKPLPINKAVKRSDLPVMTLATLVFAALLFFTGGVPRWGAAVMLVMMICYIAYLFINSRRDSEAREALTGDIGEDDQGLLRSLVEFGGGLAALIFGAKYFVSGTVCAARLMHVPESVIALTVVAIGTSLPELAASLIATKKGETDIAVGNIVGSNIWNILCIMGIAPLVRPIALKNISMLDLGAMVIISLLAIPFVYIGRNITRFAGIIWLMCYIIYLALLVIKHC